MGLWTEYILVQGYISSLQSAETGDEEESSVGVKGRGSQKRAGICDSLRGKVAAGATVFSENERRQWDWEMEVMRPNRSRSGGRPREEAYPAVVPGLQLRALWNRNHMRGVFCGIKTNTQGLNHN